jgi:hypothetical protein
MRMILAVLLLTALAACGGQAASTTQQVATEEAGDIPNVRNETPTGLDLPQSTTSDDGTLTVSYPNGWFARSGEGGNTVVISNTEGLASTADMEAIESGQAIMMVTTIPREVFEESNVGLNDMARTISDDFAAAIGSSGATFGDPAEGELNGFPSVTLTGSVTHNEQPSDLHIILVDREEDNVILQLVLLAANGESEQFEGTAQEVAGSVTLQTTDGTEEFDTNNVIPEMDETAEVDAGTPGADETPEATPST